MDFYATGMKEVISCWEKCILLTQEREHGESEQDQKDKDKKRREEFRVSSMTVCIN